MPVPHLKVREILFSRPHLIHPSYLSSILSGLGDRIGLDADMVLQAIDDDRLQKSSSGAEIETDIEVPNSIAMVQVHGTLVHRGGWLEGCGIRSYENIRADIEEALANSNVSAILMDIDSGGGECAGLFDFADWLVEAGRQKPIYAFSHDAAFSAAYAIASCSKKLFVAQAGGVGSIGVVAVHYDCSGANQKAGVVVTPIYAGDKKVDGWPHAPLSDSAKQDFQREINSTYDLFVGLVGRNRGLSEDAVRATQAGCFTAKDAVQNGLADQVASFDQVIEEIFADLKAANQSSGPSALKNATAQQKGNDMPIKLFGRDRKAESQPAEDDDKNLPTDSEDQKEDQTDEMAEGDQEDEVSSEDQAPEETDVEEESEGDDPEDGDVKETAKADGYAEALGVVELAVLSGKSAKSALKMLEKGMTVAEARHQLLSEKKTKAKDDVSGHHKGAAAPETDRVAAKVNARFQK